MAKSAWAFVDEVWQVLLWMAGLGFVIMIIGRTLQSFLALPLVVKLFLWFAVAVVCKHWRDIRSWYEKQRPEARQQPPSLNP